MRTTRIHRNPSSHVRARLGGVAFACSLFLFLLLALEFSARTYHILGARISWTAPDTLFGWRYTPHAEYWFHQENPRPVSGRLNNFGWRDRDWLVAKPPHTIRVALLGDSFVEAFQVERQHSFQAVAETELATLAPAQHFELLNFGRSGFTTSEELLVLQHEVAPFAPDLVVLFFYAENDIDDIKRELATSILRPFFLVAEDGSLALDLSFRDDASFKLKQRVNGIKQRSAIISLISEHVNALFYRGTDDRQPRAAGTGVAFASQRGSIRGALSLATSRPDPAFAEAFALNLRLLAEIVAQCEAIGAQLLLLNVNLKAYTPERIAALLERDPSFDPGYFDRELAAFAQRHGIDFISLQEIFAANYVENGQSLTWGHWNHAGHQLVGMVLAGYLAAAYLEAEER